MVLPGLLGYWGDSQLRTTPIFTVLGFAGGLALGMYHLVKMTRGPQGASDDSSDRNDA